MGYDRVAANPMATYELDFEEEARIVASLPTPRMGVLSRKLDERGWDEGVATLRRHGIEVPYLIHGIFAAVDDDAGWAAEADLLARTLDLAPELGSTFVYMCTGPAGRLPWEEAASRFAERLAPAAARAAELGIDLVVENSMSIWSQCSFVFSLRDTVALARQAGLKLCVDLVACWIERGLSDTVHGAVDLIRLVQVSDRDIHSLAEPDRRVPGDADLPLERLVGDILAAGYEGMWDVELVGPAIDAEGPGPALRRGIDWLAEALDRLAPAPSGR